MSVYEKEERQRELEDLHVRIEEYRRAGLTLDMARGKPSCAQVELSRPLLDILTSEACDTPEESDAYNYGQPLGLPSARALVSELIEVPSSQLMICGSSSLNLMHDVVAHAYTHGLGGCTPWSQLEEVAFLCPSPGYDRHFAITEHYGITNIPVAMTDEGPDMDEVRRLVESDERIKGIWCVPRFANPTGVTYSASTLQAFADLQPKAPDFRIFWDNAYAFHEFAREVSPAHNLGNLFELLVSTQSKTRMIGFGSFAKVTFPSSALAWMYADEADFAELTRAFAVRRVSPEKLSQVAHVRYFTSKEKVYEHMHKHAELLRPHFELVEEILTKQLSDLEEVSWSHPEGGYFVSFEAPEGCAKRIVGLMKELGVTLTSAGATWPYGEDPHDSNIRLAPTYPSLEELRQALEVFVVVVRMVCHERASA